MDFEDIEEEFSQLLQSGTLDNYLANHPEFQMDFLQAIESAISDAYETDNPCPEAQLFLQRILYHINRLKLFWYDNLTNYANEDSPFLFLLRNKIESAWQTWEESELHFNRNEKNKFLETLQDHIKEDLNPVPSKNDLFIRNGISKKGYCRLLALASLNGLVEASQLSRMLGGVGNEIQSMLTRIFLEEYGGGKLARKHSTFFEAMLTSLGLNPEPETYFDLVPWEFLANINHSFYLCERKRFFLRYMGGLLYTETATPAAFMNYKLAGQRLCLEESSFGYWDLHMKEDERHGQWMFDDVALPLIKQYPEDSWQILLGYEQEKFMNQRMGRALVESIREAENS